jgi:hypothetical protein
MSATAATTSVFSQSSTHLSGVLREAEPLLRKITDAEANVPRSPEKWSRKEIVGHLLDSASNNHQRFVRAALQGELTFPGYSQEALVKLERFRDLPWTELLDFWLAYNRFLAHLMASLPPASEGVQCKIGNDAPVTLGWIVSDYVEHLKHHLNQVLGEHWKSSYKPE